MSELNADFIFKNIFKIVTAISIILAFAFILTPFLIPLLLGGILAMAFSPFVAFFMNRGWSRRLSVIVLSLGIFILGMTPVTIILMRGTKIVTHFLNEESLLIIKHKIQDKVDALLANFADIYDIDLSDAHDKFDSLVGTIGKWGLDLFSNFLSQIPNVAMLSFITILSFYFFLIDEVRIRKWFDRYFNFTNGNGDRFISLIKASCNEIFFSNVLTGFIQASVVATGAFFSHTGDVFIVFFCTFFLSFIPVIGAGPVAFAVAALAFIDGRVGAGIAMSVVGVIAGIVDNLIRPYLTSRGEVKVPVYVSFLSIIGGVIVIGLPGLFLGPLLASLTYGALPIIIDEFFQKEGPEAPNDQPGIL
ncbi:MAG: AI-2E family transporter [Bacteriovorax sp.]|jgi:predicted PurR-regulated permease PerM